jgi:hypothetical protein
MSQRPSPEYRPALERLEEKRPLSGVTSPAAIAHSHHQAPAVGSAGASNPVQDEGSTIERTPAQRGSRVTGVTLDRITNPTPFNAVFKPPFAHVLVQSRQPVPGQVYNVLFISVYNATGRTFNASDNLTVRITDQTPAHAVPILTGTQQWKPRERMVFYVLTKQYYPLSPVVSAGFQFNFIHPPVTAIPGPSGIFLRVKYNPATFARVLDTIVVSGPGARGHELGLPDTAIWEIIPAGSVIPL